jgi:hypothetical protein
MSEVLVVRGVDEVSRDEESPSEALVFGVPSSSNPGRIIGFEEVVLRTAERTPETAFASFFSAFSIPWGLPSPEFMSRAIAWILS